MIGEVVVDLGLSDRETVEDAVTAAREQGRPTGLILVERGILRHDQLARVVAERFGLDFVDLSTFDLDMGAVNLIGAETARRYQAVPVGFAEDGALLVAMANPTNVLTIDDIGMMTGRRVRPCAASIEDLDLLLGKLTRMDESIEDIVDEDEEGAEEDLRLSDSDEQAPVIKLVHSIVAQADPAGRLRHPHQPRGGRHARDVPRRRGARAGGDGQAQDERLGRLAHQDHGRTRHLRATRAPGRALRVDASTGAASTSAWSRCRSSTARAS